jgi:glycosyltransferase involved in cell wall biosynthesis
VQSASFVTVAMLRSATRGTLESADVLVSFLEGETTLFSRLRARRGRPTLSYLAGVLDLRWARADRSAVRLATSAMLAEQAAQHGLACDGVLTPGIDAGLLRLPRRAPSNGQQRLLYVGRLEPNKRVERLLPLVSALEGATLTVVGDGPCRAELLAAARAQGVSERVIFRGPLAPSAVADALRQADVFVFPSAYESFGAAVLEAMGAGLPIVATDLPALREATGGHALLVADDPATWVRCTREVLEDAERYARLSVEGRAWAADFTWERIVDRFDAYLQVALQSTTAQST